AVEPLQRQDRQGREHPRLPALQLERARRLAVRAARAHPRGASLLRRGPAGGGARRKPDRGGPPPLPAPPRGGAEAAARAVPHPGLLPAERRHRVRRGYGARPARRDAPQPAFGAAGPRHRPRRGGIDGNQEARGVLLMAVAANEIEEQLLIRAGKELVRLVIIGSVDDGKSTLIGRLLYETGALYEDQIAHVRRATKNGDPIDFSLFTDGLKAEREQGITIDVAYRYFETGRRKFILA